MLNLAWRMVRSTEPRLLWKFAYNFGWKGMRSVQLFKKRLKQGVVFPPFLYLSITSRCNLRCQGCWVDVRQPENELSFEEMDRLVSSAKARGNAFFGILGGEPFMHPDLMRLLAKHPDCYFQIFTNGHYITDEVAEELRRIGNATPLISVEGTEEVSDARRGGTAVLSKTMRGLETCLRHKLITGVAASVCQTDRKSV
ncbi:MAG: radical SAM protein, partial [Planctomycetota bacterium JB042]